MSERIKQIVQNSVLLVVTSLLFFFGCMNPVLAVHGPQDSSGADGIFDDAGIEKPVDWATWSGQKKFDFLIDLDIYPLRGQKYEGEFDIDRYFDALGVGIPNDWYEMTSSERVQFVKAVKEDSKAVQNLDEESIAGTDASGGTKSAFDTVLLAVASLMVLGGIWGAVKAKG